MAQRLATGRIVWADIADANGIRKLRPCVIVTPTDRISAGGPIDVIAITSRLAPLLPVDHVMLPWHRAGHPRTGLKQPCAAVCTWLAQLAESDIREVAGMVPTPIMTVILAKLAAVLSPSPPASGKEPSTCGSSGGEEAMPK